MNTSTRHTLDAARARGQDDTEPEIAAALSSIEADEKASAWFTQRRQEDASIGLALRSIEPPAELHQRIQRGAMQNSSQSVMSRRWFIPTSAAAAATVLAGLYWRSTRSFTTDQLTAAVAKISADGIKLSLMTMDKNAVVKWLANAKAPRALSLPSKLDAITRKGCHVYEIKGNEVSLECFVLEGSMRQLHLFTVKASALADAVTEAEGGRVEKLGDQTVALWARDSHVMILLSREPKEDIQALIS